MVDELYYEIEIFGADTFNDLGELLVEVFRFFFVFLDGRNFLLGDSETFGKNFI